MKKFTAMLVTFIMVFNIAQHIAYASEVKKEISRSIFIPNDESGIPDKELYNLLDKNKDGRITEYDVDNASHNIHVNKKVKSLKGLNYFEKTKNLVIYANDKQSLDLVSNLEFIRCVQVLNINKDLIIDNFINCPKVNQVILSGAEDLQIKPRINLSFLDENIKNISFSSLTLDLNELNMKLKTFSNIKDLTLSEIKSLDDTYYLEATDHLESVSIRGKKFNSIEQIKSSTSIKSIVFFLQEFTPDKPTSIEGITKFINLETLYVDFLDIDKFEDMSVLKNFKTLSIRYSKINELNFEDFPDSLEKVIIGGSKINYVNNITDKKNLQYLNIIGDIVRIGNIKGVDSCYIYINSPILESIGDIKEIKKSRIEIPFVYGKDIDTSIGNIQNINDNCEFNIKGIKKIKKIEEVYDSTLNLGRDVMDSDKGELNSIDSINNVKNSNINLKGNNLKDLDSIGTIKDSIIDISYNYIDITNQDVINKIYELKENNNTVVITPQKEKEQLDIDPTHKYIRVMDSEFGLPLSNVKVEVLNKIYKTDKNGLVDISEIDGNQIISLEKGGYIKHNEKIRVTNGVKYIYLGKDIGEPLSITAANIYDIGGSKDKNVLYSTATYEKNDSLQGECQLEIFTSWHDVEPTIYKLLVGDEIVQLSEDGIFKFNPKSILKENEKVYVIIETIDSNVNIKKELKIKLLNTGESSDPEFAKSIGVPVEETVPLLGGQDFKMRFGKIPVSIGTDKNKNLKMIIGMRPKDDDFSSVVDKLNEEYDSLKTAEDISNFKGTDIKRIPPITNFSDLSELFRVKADVIGEVLIKPVGNNESELSGKLKTSGEITCGGTYKYLLGPVPAFIKMRGGLSLNVDSSFGTWHNKKLLPFEQLKIGANINPGVGVGLPDLVCVELLGKAEISHQIKSYEDYQKVLANASAQFKMTALLFEYSIDGTTEDYVIYEEPQNKSSSLAMYSCLTMTDNNVKELEFKPASRRYINNTTEWNSNNRKNSSNGKGVVQSGIYQNAQPVRFDLNGKQAMLFLTDDLGRNSLDRTKLVYSILDEETNKWSEPVAVDDDRTADFNAQVVSLDDKAYIIWQNSSKVFDSEKPDLNEWLSNSEIKVAELNSDGIIEEASVKVISEASKMAVSNKVYFDGSNIHVAWSENSANDYIRATGHNTIYTSTFDGNTWSNPLKELETNKQIVSYEIGSLNGKTMLTYSVDEDNSLDTINDREVYVKETQEEPIRLTNNNVIDSNPTFKEVGEDNKLIWYSDSNLVEIGDVSQDPKVLSNYSNGVVSDQFKVVNGRDGETAILTIIPDENGNKNVYSSKYSKENNEWGKFINVTKLDSNVLDYDANMNEDGGFDFSLISYDKDIDNADLSAITVNPYSDISLETIRVEEWNAKAGEKFPISLNIKNSGLKDINKVNVVITNSLGATTSEIVDVNIPLGESKNVESSVILPQPLKVDDYCIKVEPVGDTDINIDDNSKTIKIGAVDLRLGLEEAEVGNRKIANLSISNFSEIPANARLKITEDSIDGKVVKTEQFKGISKEKNGIYSYQIELDKVKYNEDGLKKYYFTLESDDYEVEKHNNTQLVILCNQELRDKYNDNKEKKISLNTNSIVLHENEENSLGAYIVNGDGNEKIDWTSSDESVVTVDENGNIKAVKGGYAEIIATINGTKISSICSVYVNQVDFGESEEIGNKVDSGIFNSSLVASNGNIKIRGGGAMNLYSTNVSASEGLEIDFIGSKLMPQNIFNKQYQQLNFKNNITMVDKVTMNSTKDLVSKAIDLDEGNASNGIGKFKYKDYTVILANVGSMKNGKFVPGDLIIGDKFSIDRLDKTIIITNGNLILNSMIITATQSTLLANSIDITGVASLNITGSVVETDSFKGYGLSKDDGEYLFKELEQYLK